MLATTSYPDRTSPVLRGKWLLNNIFGLQVPPPPPGVDTNLGEPKPGARPPAIRERLARHRRNPACASCHATIDPLGFTLENFDAIGAWRGVDESGAPVDAVGATAGGIKVEGLSGLRALLLDEPDQFPRTLTAKLLAYALGRRIEFADRPAVPWESRRDHEMPVGFERLRERRHVERRAGESMQTQHRTHGRG